MFNRMLPGPLFHVEHFATHGQLSQFVQREQNESKEYRHDVEYDRDRSTIEFALNSRRIVDDQTNG